MSNVSHMITLGFLIIMSLLIHPQYIYIYIYNLWITNYFKSFLLNEWYACKQQLPLCHRTETPRLHVGNTLWFSISFVLFLIRVERRIGRMEDRGLSSTPWNLLACVNSKSHHVGKHLNVLSLSHTFTYFESKLKGERLERQRGFWFVVYLFAIM